MNKHFIRTIAISIIAGIYFPVYAQQRSESERIRFARFDANQTNVNRRMSKDTIFLKSILNAKPEDEFRLRRVTTDNLGITHKRFQQYYKGIKVENAEYLIHGKGDNIDYINGDFQVINIQSVEPILNEQQALAKALKYVGAEKYKWEDANAENFIKEHRNDTNATYYPYGELVIAKDYLKDTNSFKLAWKFLISSLKPNNEQKIIVDANSGDIIQDASLIQNSGNAQTLYSGTQYIRDSYSSGSYRLRETRNT